MQESFEVSSSSGSYKVIAGLGLLNDVIQKNPEAIYLIDECLESRLPENLCRRIVIKANEKNKSLEEIPEVIIKMRELGANRGSCLVVIGGGVLQDIGTFVASVYMRGLTWIYMPTTFLGMADSCIGGKSSINVMGYKNLIGNFYPPLDVIIDVSFISSLNGEQIVGGLYEAAKICYAHSYKEFLSYLSKNPSDKMSPGIAMAVIMHALRTKKWFIEIDEFDQKERLLLNFGHTFGHAIEAGTDFAVSHGIAVGVGILVAIEYARGRGCLTDEGLNVVNHLKSHVHSLLGYGAQGVVDNLPHLDLSLIIEKFNNDKKHFTEKYRMVIPQEDGALKLITETKNDKVHSDIISAYQNVFTDIGWCDVVNMA